jgi:hypothetical protein
MKGPFVTPHFFKAITYNVANIFLYKIILQLHQTALFFIIPSTMFGLIGTLFSSIYFLISITNIGFDYFIIMHHSSYTSCQKNFKKLFFIFIARLITVLCIIILLWFINNHYKLCPVSNILNHTNPLLLTIIVFIFISESIKKSLDALAQMSFLQRSITFFDISTIIMYAFFVWSSYFLFQSISLYTIFIPMAFISILECYLLTNAIRSFYNRLPAADSRHPTPQVKEIITHQIINYINQITKALFSPNFFILIFACYFGLSKAGYIKLFTDSIVLLYMLLNRSFGLPTAALFSSLSKDSDTSSKVFIKITNWYIQFLYALAMTIALLFYFYGNNDSFSSSIVSNVIIFIFAGFIEYLLIAYEKWYLTQNKSLILATINGVNLLGYLLLFLVCTYYSDMPLVLGSVLMPIIILRVLSLISIIYVTHKIWHITPSFKITHWTILVTLFTTFISLLLRKILYAS